MHIHQAMPHLNLSPASRSSTLFAFQALCVMHVHSLVDAVSQAPPTIPVSTRDAFSNIVQLVVPGAQGPAGPGPRPLFLFASSLFFSAPPISLGRPFPSPAPPARGVSSPFLYLFLRRLPLSLLSPVILLVRAPRAEGSAFGAAHLPSLFSLFPFRFGPLPFILLLLLLREGKLRLGVSPAGVGLVHTGNRRCCERIFNQPFKIPLCIPRFCLRSNPVAYAWL
jgi:hypothetical protein